MPSSNTHTREQIIEKIARWMYARDRDFLGLADLQTKEWEDMPADTRNRYLAEYDLLLQDLAKEGLVVTNG